MPKTTLGILKNKIDFRINYYLNMKIFVHTENILAAGDAVLPVEAGVSRKGRKEQTNANRIKTQLTRAHQSRCSRKSEP